MSQQSQPSDSRSATVLDLSPLTRMEAATLLNTLRNAQLDIEESNFAVSYQVWQDIVVLRLEVREVFLKKFFEVTP